MRDEIERVDTVSRPAIATSIWRALRRRWSLAVAVSATVCLGVSLFTLTKHPRYSSETLILLGRNTYTPVVPTTGTNNGAYEQNNDNDNDRNLSTEIQILQSRPLVAKALRELNGSYRNLTVEQVVGNLSIRQPEKAGVLSISYTDTDPQRVKAVLEVLGSTYVKYSSERERSRTTNAINLIEAKLPTAKEALQKSSSAIEDFRKRYGISDPDSYATAVAQNQQLLEQQAQEAKTALGQAQRQYQELRRQMAEASQAPGTVIADAILSQDSGYQKLVNQLQEVETQYAQESIRFRDTHPKIRELKMRRDRILSLLQHQAQLVLGNKVSQIVRKDSVAGQTQQSFANQLLQVQTTMAVESARLDSIHRAQAEAVKRFQQIPYLQQNYVNLRDQYNLNSQVVNGLLQQLQELQIIAAQDLSPWRILEPPYLPTTPISPNIKRDLLLSLFTGGLLGVGAAFLLEQLDKRIKEMGEVKELTGIPILGAVPKADMKVIASKDGENTWSQQYSRSPFTQSLFSLALNLQFLDSGKVKTLAFTSASYAEGKTTVTSNLGLALADLGCRVLVVDTNLCKPSIHILFQESNTFGLTTALATSHPWRELVRSSIFSNKLDIMTSGPLVSDPIALLVSEQMKMLLDEWKQVYDYVLLDTPPIVGFAETQSIVSRVDGVILVVAMELSTRPAIAHAMEVISRSQREWNIVGSAINLLKEDSSHYPSSASNQVRSAPVLINAPLYRHGNRMSEKLKMHLAKLLN